MYKHRPKRGCCTFGTLDVGDWQHIGPLLLKNIVKISCADFPQASHNNHRKSVRACQG